MCFTSLRRKAGLPRAEVAARQGELLPCCEGAVLNAPWPMDLKEDVRPLLEKTTSDEFSAPHGIARKLPEVSRG